MRDDFSAVVAPRFCVFRCGCLDLLLLRLRRQVRGHPWAPRYVTSSGAFRTQFDQPRFCHRNVLLDVYCPRQPKLTHRSLPSGQRLRRSYCCGAKLLGLSPKPVDRTEPVEHRFEVHVRARGELLLESRPTQWPGRAQAKAPASSWSTWLVSRYAVLDRPMRRNIPREDRRFPSNGGLVQA